MPLGPQAGNSEGQQRRTYLAPIVHHALNWRRRADLLRVQIILGEAEVVLLPLGDNHADLLDLEQDDLLGRCVRHINQQGVGTGADDRCLLFSGGGGLCG